MGMVLTLGSDQSPSTGYSKRSLWATFMYFYCHNLLPNSFRDLFSTNHQVHQHETRFDSPFSTGLIFVERILSTEFCTSFKEFIACFTN